ncbi:MAG: hypothetical protein EPN55_06250, partial [Gammaproteobacteria bacterium]
MATVNEYAWLSNEVYKDGGGNPGTGWEVLRVSSPNSSGYYGTAYYRLIPGTTTYEIVIAHRGTQLWDTNDLKSDWQIIVGQNLDQFTSASSFYETVLQEAERLELSISTISHTGHSLGGAIARELAIANGQTAALFNAPGYANGTPLPVLVSSTQILSVNSAYDVVSEYGWQVGTVKEVYVSSFPFIPDKFEVLAYLPVFGPFSWFQALRFGFSQHSMDNLLEVIQALPAGSLGFPANSGGLDFSPNYEITGAWLDEWQSFEDTVQDITSQVPTGPLPEGDLTTQAIRGEQNLDPATPVSFDNNGVGTLIVGENGADVLNGSTGNDLLFGDDGNDTLNGEGGNDFLLGGAGFDTYLIHPGDGNDIVVDSDGQGAIVYGADGQAQRLILGIRESTNLQGQYHTPDGQFTFTWSGTLGTDLNITTPDGAVTIKNYHPNDLGIRLVEQTPIVPLQSFTGSGNDDVDLLDLGLSSTMAGGQLLGYASNMDWAYFNVGEVFNYRNFPDTLGNLYYAQESGDYRWLYGGGGNDFMVGYTGAQNVLLDGGNGNDWIIANYKDLDEYVSWSITLPPDDPALSDFGATIDGGTGNDAIQGSFREDWIEAGAGHDQVQGGEEGDYIDGGTGNDWINGSELNGEADDDIIIGGPDSLTGGETDNDVLMGGGGKDILIGGAGNDLLYGDAEGYAMRRLVYVAPYSYIYPSGYPEIYYGRWSYGMVGWNGSSQSYILPTFHFDTVTEQALYRDTEGGADYLEGGSGQDRLFGGGGGDILDSGVDDDKLYGEAGDDDLYGGAGNDELWGDIDPIVYAQDQAIIETHGSLSVFTRQYLGGPDVSGNDILEGGAGNDAVHGGAGDDTYIFDLGDGRDMIEDQTAPDEGNLIAFGEGIRFEDIVATLNGDTLTLQVGTGGDAIDFLHFDVNGNHVVDYLQFFDGSMASVLDFVPHTMDGNGGDNVIYGDSQNNFIEALDGNDRVATYVGDDVISGGAGNDILEGGVGDDTYIFNLGDGVDTVIDRARPSEGNRIVFGEGIAPDSLSLDFGSLLIRVGGAGDALHLTTFDPNDVYGQHSVETFQFADGTILGYRQLIDRGFDLNGAAANDTITGTNGIDRIAGAEGDDLLVGGAGDDSLNGGIGNDGLHGGVGADTYIYNRGTGDDVINDDGVQGEIDTIAFGEGISLNDLVFTRTGDDLLIRVTDPANPLTTGKITVQRPYADPTHHRIEQFRFADGTVIDGQMAEMVASAVGTPGSRILQGGSTDDVIYGLSNIDYLFGGAGNDLLYGAENNNYLAGETGNDTLIGGLGDDTLDGGEGDDTYAYNFGDGTDSIFDADGLGRIIYRDAQGREYQLDGGARLSSSGTYYDESGRFAYNLNGHTLTVTLDNKSALTIQDYDPLEPVLGIELRTYLVPEIHVANGAPEPIRLVSASADGAQGNNGSNGAAVSLSANSRFVAFESNANNLVSGDTNGATDIFVSDLQTGDVLRVSTAADGTQANGGSYGAAISADGRYVAFKSDASNLVAGDTNARTDIFVKDLQTGAITRANTTAAGMQTTGLIGGWLYAPSISADGRYVTFESDDSSLVPGDPKTNPNIFVKDLLTGNIIRANTPVDGSLSRTYSGSGHSAISANGRYVAFASDMSNLVAGDTNYMGDLFVKDLQTGIVVRANTTANGSQVTYGGIWDNVSLSADGRYVAFESTAYQLTPIDSWLNIHVKDLQTGKVTLVNSATNGTPGRSGAYTPSISADGRYVAFGGGSSNLVSGDTNGSNDIFVKDIQTGAIARVSVAANGTQANGMNEYPSISADGKYIAFISNASNLVPGDANNAGDIFVAPNPFFLPPPVTTGVNAPIALTDISVMDGDAAALPLTMMLDVGHGSLALLRTAGITFADADGRDGTLTFSGTLADINVALDIGILYASAINYIGTDTLRIGVNDHSFGTGLTDDASVALAVTSSPTPGQAIITGTAGNDVLIGGSGSNMFFGGVGDDTLVGGVGNDIYLYSVGDNSDFILDLDQNPGNTDTLSFGSGITPDTLSAEASGYDLLIHIGDEILTIQNWFMGADYRIEHVQFENGENHDDSWLAALGKHAPELNVPIPDQAVNEDSPFSFALSPDTFTDQDITRGDVLSYSASLADGNTLPTWLGFDTATGTFSGLVGNALVGSYHIEVIATDSDGQSISDTFTLTVNNVNDAPVVLAAISDQVADEDAPFSFALDPATFADDDLIHGDSLILSAAMSDGSALPDWLTFDVATGTFTGTPDNWQVGTYDLRVTATDLAGTSASDVFSLTINNVNDNPVLVNALNDLTTDEDALFSFTVPINTFDDDDFIHGDRLTLSTALADGSVLPDWLTFDAATGTFSGTPDNWDVGSYEIRVTATDVAGLSVSDTFTLAVNNVNDAPVVANAIPDQLATEGAAFSYAVAGGTFADDDAIHGDVLSCTASLADGSVLPSWLSFDASTQTFTGTAPIDSTLTGTDGDDVLIDSDTGISGAWDIRVSATDTSGVSADDTFTLTLQGIAGNDTLNGGKGNDVLNGGGG